MTARRRAWRGLAPDLILALAVLGFATLLTGLADPPPGAWTWLAWGQYLWVVLMAVLVQRGAARADSAPLRRGAILGGGVLVILAVSLLAHRHDPYFWDAATTSARASLIHEGGSLVGSRERFSLFYHFLALLQAVCGHAAAAPRLVVAAVGVAGLASLGLLAARHGSRTAGLAAAVLAASTPPLFVLLHWLYIDMFLLALGLALLLACDRQVRRPHPVGLVVCVAVAGAALLTKEYAVVVLPVALSLGWVHTRDPRTPGAGGAGRTPGTRRRAAVSAVAVVVAVGLGWGLWRLYLNFWRGLFQQGEPSWEFWPLLIIPGHPFITAGDQLRLGADLVRQHLAQTAGSGLLGLALLGLVDVPKARRFSLWVMLVGAVFLAVWPPCQLAPTQLNALWRWGAELHWVAPAVLLALWLLRLAGQLTWRVTRWQTVMLVGVAVSALFFACVAKVTRIDGRLAAFLDWRYPLFSYAFLAVLAGEGVARLLAWGRAGGRLPRAAAALVPALLVAGNLVGGTNYVRQVAAYTQAQLRGVRTATTQARARSAPVLTTWPYYYPEVDRPLDYGPFRWASEGVTLEFLAFHDRTSVSDRIALFDTRTGSPYVVLAEREGVRRFPAEAPLIAPLRPRVVRWQGPQVLVVDLASPPLAPPFAPFVEDFAAKPDTKTPDRWTGLGACEVWATDLTVRWSVGDEVRTTLGPAAGSGFRVELRAMAFAGVPEQTVTLRVNGTDLEALPLPPRWSDLVWTVPAGLVRSGALNEVTFVPRGTASPAARGDQASNDRRRLGVALDRLRIAEAPAEN